MRGGGGRSDLKHFVKKLLLPQNPQTSAEIEGANLPRVGHFSPQGLLLYKCAVLDSFPQKGTKKTVGGVVPPGTTREILPYYLGTRTWGQRRVTGAIVSRGSAPRPWSVPARGSVGVVDVERYAFRRSPGSPACGRKSNTKGVPKGGRVKLVPPPLLLMMPSKNNPYRRGMFRERKTSRTAVLLQHAHLEEAALRRQRHRNLLVPPA